MKFPESLGRLVHFRNTVSGKTLRREHCVGNTVDTGPKTIGGLASQWRIALDQKNCNFFCEPLCHWQAKCVGTVTSTKGKYPKVAHPPFFGLASDHPSTIDTLALLEI